MQHLICFYLKGGALLRFGCPLNTAQAFVQVFATGVSENTLFQGTCTIDGVDWCVLAREVQAVHVANIRPQHTQPQGGGIPYDPNRPYRSN